MKADVVTRNLRVPLFQETKTDHLMSLIHVSRLQVGTASVGLAEPNHISNS